MKTQIDMHLEPVDIFADLFDDADAVSPGYRALVVLEKVTLVQGRGENANLNLRKGRVENLIAGKTIFIENLSTANGCEMVG